MHHKTYTWQINLVYYLAVCVFRFHPTAPPTEVWVRYNSKQQFLVLREQNTHTQLVDDRMAPMNTSTKREAGTTVTETLVRGTIGVNDLPRVLFLIRALCPESGHMGEFRDHDRVYAPSSEIRNIPKNSIRLRKRILQAGPPDTRSLGLDHVLLTYGIVDRRVGLPVERRPLAKVKMGPGAPELLSMLGCTMQYEYVRAGLRYRSRQGFTIEVYVIKKLQQPGNPEGAVGLQNEDHAIVDVVSHSAINPDDLLAFMHCLEPIVVLRTSR